LAHQLTLHRPGIRVIFASGYTDDAIARQGILDSTVAFLQKPYRPKALARTIREVLRGAPANVAAVQAQPVQDSPDPPTSLEPLPHSTITRARDVNRCLGRNV
jgi:FixJ family two-component response regulator